MSVRAISRVLDSSQHAGTELLMLVVLADYSDDEGNSYPSVAALARKCRTSPRNAHYLLGALQASGELRVLKNAGPRGTNRFQIQLSKLGRAIAQTSATPATGCTPAPCCTPEPGCTPEAAFALKPTSPTPEAGFPKPLKPAAPEPSLTRQDPSLKKSTRRRADPFPCPDGVDSQTWGDWLMLRKAKKAPVTATVIAGAEGEAKKAGLSLDAFLRVWCVRGSQGLLADWLKPNERGVDSEPQWRREQRERVAQFAGASASKREPAEPRWAQERDAHRRAFYGVAAARQPGEIVDVVGMEIPGPDADPDADDA